MRPISTTFVFHVSSRFDTILSHLQERRSKDHKPCQKEFMLIWEKRMLALSQYRGEDGPSDIDGAYVVVELSCGKLGIHVL